MILSSHQVACPTPLESSLRRDPIFEARLVTQTLSWLCKTLYPFNPSLQKDFISLRLIWWFVFKFRIFLCITMSSWCDLPLCKICLSIQRCVLRTMFSMLPVIVQLRLPYETEGVTTAWKTLGRLNKLMRELHKMAWNFAHLHLIRCSTSAKCGSEKRTCLPKYLADCVGFNIVMSPTLVFILAAQRLPNKPALIKICVFVKKRKLNQKGRHRFWLIFATL